MDELFQDELQDLYDAENQIVNALPKMAKAAQSAEVRAALQEHLEVTKRQVQRLDKIFSQMKQQPGEKMCAGMQGLIEEGEELIEEGEPSAVLDAGLIAAAQKVEHYEIASYGTARTHAQQLGHDEIASLLEQTLEEEKQTDEKLTALAESSINQEAARKR
jgi:ferritin-like metal-binding protein YciE